MLGNDGPSTSPIFISGLPLVCSINEESLTMRTFPSVRSWPMASGTSRNNFGGRDSHWALDIQNVNTAAVGASYISAIPPSPIPEPESYALLLAGLGLVSLAARRRLSL